VAGDERFRGSAPHANANGRKQCFRPFRILLENPTRYAIESAKKAMAINVIAPIALNNKSRISN
jgi:hypothetical protein